MIRGHRLRRGLLGSAAAGIVLAEINIDNSSIVETAAVDTVVGTLSGMTPGSVLSLVDDAGGLFKLVGDEIQVAAALDYETATSHNITVRETLAEASNSPRDTALVINVTNDFTDDELVSNGTFDVDTAGWTPTGAALSVSGGRLRVTSDIAGPAYASHTVNGLVVGATYRFLATIIPVSGVNYGRIRLAGADTYTHPKETLGENVDRTFVAATTSLTISTDNASSGSWGGGGSSSEFDDISLKRTA